MNISTAELEKVIAEEAGVFVAAEVSGDEVELTGMATTEGEHQAALDVAREFLSDRWRLIDNIEVTSVLPEMLPGLDLSTADSGDFRGATPDTEDDEALEPGDFTDQQFLGNAEGASGPTGGTGIDEEYGEGEEVWVPPTDPPSDGDQEFIGGFQTTSMDEEPVGRSEVVGGSADEAIRDAVLHELREDASTTNLIIEIDVFEGVVALRGLVDDILDAENAEAVAARVPGVREVRERLKLRQG